MNFRYRLEHLTKRYGESIVANDDINLEIAAGQVFGLLGPNGAGKSTLVRQMVGLLRPDIGCVYYDDLEVGPGDLNVRQRVAYLSQRPLALFDLTVREAIVATGRLRRLSRGDASMRAVQLIDELNLVDCADRIVAKLSGGQHRLVALGSALIGDVDTLVLDEPTNELDPELRRKVWTVLRERCRDQGTTIVLVTHNALEAEQVIDRLAVLVNGRVRALGTPGEIKASVDGNIRVELVFREPIDGDLEKLHALGAVQISSANRATLTASRAEARGVIDRVLASFSLEVLDDFRILTPTLEDVYLHVASRDREAIPV